MNFDCAARGGDDPRGGGGRRPAAAGHDERDSTSFKAEIPDYRAELAKRRGPWKLGIPKEYFIEGIDPEIEKSVRQAAEIYKKLGAEINEAKKLLAREATTLLHGAEAADGRAALPWLATPPASAHHRLQRRVFGPGSLTGLEPHRVALVFGAAVPERNPRTRTSRALLDIEDDKVVPVIRDPAKPNTPGHLPNYRLEKESYEAERAARPRRLHPIGDEAHRGQEAQHSQFALIVARGGDLGVQPAELVAVKGLRPRG